MDYQKIHIICILDVRNIPLYEIAMKTFNLNQLYGGLSETVIDSLNFSVLLPITNSNRIFNKYMHVCLMIQPFLLCAFLCRFNSKLLHRHL